MFAVKARVLPTVRQTVRRPATRWAPTSTRPSERSISELSTVFSHDAGSARDSAGMHLCPICTLSPSRLSGTNGTVNVPRRALLEHGSNVGATGVRRACEGGCGRRQSHNYDLIALANPKMLRVRSPWDRAPSRSETVCSRSYEYNTSLIWNNTPFFSLSVQHVKARSANASHYLWFVHWPAVFFHDVVLQDHGVFQA